jgi:curved DNA-binding protein CbpA
MNDPYKVLDISPDATDEEVKKAYRNLARKYHPDNYVNHPLADIVEEKMKEINEAYELIQKQRSQKTTNNDRDQSGSSRTNLNQIRIMINQGRYAEAGTYLEYVPLSERNAEWFFLEGCVLLHRGYFYDAQGCFERACYMDPSNVEYRDTLDKIRNVRSERHDSYTSGSGKTYNASCSVCDICTTLMCTECCCNCLGCDIIRCC